MRLADLKGFYDRLRFEPTIECLQNPEIASLPDLSFIQQGRQARRRSAQALISTLYEAGKRLVFSDRQPDALRGIRTCL